MGLNFRKSISILPGVKLNLSKGGVGVSAGVPGFRKSINTKGQTTTTISIPGTGLYYTNKKKVFGNKKNEKKEDKKTEKKTETKKTEKTTKAKEQTKAATAAAAAAEPLGEPVKEAVVQVRDFVRDAAAQPAQRQTPARQIDAAALKSIHKTADDTIDWGEIMSSPTAPDESCNQDMWAYYHSVAPEIIGGDLDAYLRLIYEVNPLDDLLEYGSEFQFGTDSPGKMEVEFELNEELLEDAKDSMNRFQFNDLLQDFVCSLSIRIARDMFALLPVNRTFVHAMIGGKTVLSANFDRDTLSKVKFGMIDPSDTLAKFPHNMSYSASEGFAETDRL